MQKRATERMLEGWGKGEGGAVLVIALLLIAALVAMGAAMITITSTDTLISGNYRTGVEALYRAEAGVATAQALLAAGKVSDKDKQSDPNWKVTESSKGFDNSFTIVHKTQDAKVVTDAVGYPLYVVTSTGNAGKAHRQIEVEMAINSPIAPTGAINILGDVTKHAKLDIKSDKKREGNEILVSGIDAAGVSNGLALGVEDPSALKDIIDQLTKDFKKEDLEAILKGDPVGTFTDKKGENAFKASVGAADSHGFDAALIEQIAETEAARVRGLLPTLTIDPKADPKKDPNAFPDPGKDGVTRLGTSKASVVVIKDGNLKLEKGLVIEGQGTLVIDGGDVNLHDVTFNWTGDIYILGKETHKDDSKLQVHEATVNITGDLFVLGSDNGKAKLRFSDDNGKSEGTTTINGSITAFSGTGEKSRVELKANHGDLTVNGLVTLTGSRVDLDLHQDGKDGNGKDKGKDNDDDDIKIRGGIAILLPDEKYDDKNTKADIKLRAHGEGEGNLTVQYDSKIVGAAVKRLLDKLGDLPKQYTITSWREGSSS